MPSLIANEIGRNCDFGNILPQKFSLPSTFIYYITKNPGSPSLYRNLIRSCKYFYSKNRIILADKMEIRENKVVICKNEVALTFPISKISQIPCKFWITEKITFFNVNNLATEILRDKMFRFSGLFFESIDFILDQFLPPKFVDQIKVASFKTPLPKYADGILMPLEKVFGFFRNLECFEL